MAVRQSPGVYVTEYDLTGGLETVGIGGVGIAVKLDKGPVGKPFAISGEKDLIRKGGYPLPGFNLMGWHSVNNMFLYGADVIVSRVEKTILATNHDTVKQYFEIPTQNAQLAIHMTGDAVNLSLDSELNMMIKNRELFKTTNINNVYDVANPDDGVDISEIDPTILVDNFDTLEILVEDNAFNTKASKLVKYDTIAPKVVVEGDIIPELEAGQVYGANGQISSIGSSVYDYDIIEVTDGLVDDGAGTITREETSGWITGTDSDFTGQLIIGSTIVPKWYSSEFTFTLETGNTVSRTGLDYKQLTFDSEIPPTSGTYMDFKMILGAGDKLIIDSVEREISSVDFTSPTVTINLVSDAPSSWDGAVEIGYKLYINREVEYPISSVFSDTRAIVQYQFKDTLAFATYEDKGGTPVAPVDIHTALGDIESTPSVVFENITDELIIGSTAQITSLYFNLTTVSPSTSLSTFVFAYHDGGSYVDIPSYSIVDETNNFQNSGHIYLAFDKTDWDADATVFKLRITLATEATDVEASIGIISAVPIIDSADATFGYKYLQSTETVSEKLYRDTNDTTYKTVIGVNVNFFQLLRVGSKVSVDWTGTPEVVYVTEIVSPTVMMIDTAMSNLPTVPASAKIFTYSNAYDLDGNTSVGSKLYTENAELSVINLGILDTGLNRYVVDTVSGSYNVGDKISGVQMLADEWKYFTNNITKTIDIDRDDSVYVSSYLKASSGAFAYYADFAFHNTIEVKGVAEPVFFSTNVNGATGTLIYTLSSGENTPGYLVDTTSAVSFANTHATITALSMYEDVVCYEFEAPADATTDGLVMVNEVVAGMTTTIKERYTYTVTGGDDYSETDSVTGDTIVGNEFIRIFANSPGSWADTDNLSFAMCDMDHFDTALIEEGGISFKSLFEYAPDTTDKTLMAMVVVKDDFVIETYVVSTDPTSKDSQGTSRYITDIVNRKSGYINLLFNTAVIDAFEVNGYDIHFNTVYNSMIEGGYSGKKISLFRAQYEDTSDSTANMDTVNGYVEDGDVTQAYNEFRNPDEVSIGYLVDGEWTGNPVIAKYMKSICVERGDSIAFCGPQLGDIVGIRDKDVIKANLMSYINDNNLIGTGRDFQFLSFSDNIKQVYDLYNDTYVWIALSTDISAKNSYIDNYFDPWYAVAGQARGSINNVVKLGWTSELSQRDAMYPNRINSVIKKKGTGIYIYGEKNLMSVKSDLGHNHNRKTLNFIEVNLKKYMEQVLWEFNDAITRGNVVNTIEPFLRNIKAKRGLIDYVLQCDATNNPATVIEDGTIIVAIYLKMAHVIEKVELQFTITKASVSFDEVLTK